MPRADDHTVRASDLAEAIERLAADARSEEDLRLNFELALRPVVAEFNLNISPRYEHDVPGAFASGRADAVYGGVYIEYKRPGKLSSSSAREQAISQIVDYLEAAWQASNDRWRPPRLVGVVTDGSSFIFVRPKPRHAPYAEPDPSPITSRSRWAISEALPVAAQSVGLLLHYLRALDREPLTADNLARAFGPASDIGPLMIDALYRRLTTADHPLVRTLYDEWDRIFGIVYGQDAARARSGAASLGRLYGVEDPDLKRLFFSVHTYYAFVMKILAIEVASLQQGTLIASFADSVAGLSDQEFDRRLQGLEDGSEFRRLEITNYLEGDFFRWYLSTWDSELRRIFREFLRVLDRFEPAAVSTTPDSARDILKHLYQYLVPKQLRHDLGEYYTPDWLADFVLDEIGYAGDPSIRVLDPACGSGTFLALEIGRVLGFADEHFLDEREVAQQVVQNIVGFDLNPLAVLAARTTYLLSLGPLLRHVRPLEIPVYLCDSVLLPKVEGGGLLSRGQLLQTSVGSFVVPGAIDTPSKMSAFAQVLERAVRAGHDFGGLTATVTRSVGALDESDTQLLRELYTRLSELNAEGRNGIWPRMIKNRFAPLFVASDRFDLLVGNPPWVNWESLSDDYRRATAALWREHGLFSLAGHAARLGGGKKDLSMLFTYEASQDFVRDSGVVAFVITQTVFKTTGAGAGFRRFRLSDTTPLRVRVVHDMSGLQPFEGATNRTAVMIIDRDQETTFPVRWVEWRSNAGRRPRTRDSLADVQARTTRTEMEASPIRAHDLTSPWLTVAASADAALREAVGKSTYRGYTGAFTGGLDGAFTVQVLGQQADGTMLIRNLHDVGKHKVASIETTIEPDLLYPLLRGRDVQRWDAVPEAWIVLAQDPDTRLGIPESTMKAHLPLTYEYLSNFREQLGRRRSGVIRDLMAKGAFYTMYAIGPYTMSPWKTVWREQSAKMTAAVCGPIDGRPVVPNHKLTLIPVETEDEAHYLAAVLNSGVVADIVRGYALPTSVSAHILDYVAVPRFDPLNPRHAELASLARRAREEGVEDVEGLDGLSIGLWRPA